MDAQRWTRAKELFSSALDLPVADRFALLDEACMSDDLLRSEVFSLLAAHDKASRFMETPPNPEITAASSPAEEPSLAGRRVGHYRLLRRLGYGGMGAVYLGERDDDAFRKQVAIKLVRPGLDSEQVLRRFAVERQIVADLDHPSIAKLLDGGTTAEGLPFLVMEYVAGVPIDEFCGQARLTIRQRVELFRTVCQAVAAAHRSLVIHRDIKPSNILVTVSGEPKLLDFGIAKPLLNGSAPASDATRTVDRILTPTSASPEQFRGGPIATSSDIYSLGVLLYRLLSGKHPYDLDGLSPGQMERVICEREPSSPSTALRRSFARGASKTSGIADAALPAPLPTYGELRRLSRTSSGDLDQIVLTAIRKDPRERYQSVDALSDDLERWLRGQPVRARPVGALGRLTRWCRRNRSLAASLAAALAIFVTGFALVTWQWWRATIFAEQLAEQQRVANRQAAEARLQTAVAEQRLLQTVRAVREFAQFRSIGDDQPQRTDAFLRMIQHFQQVLDRPPDDPGLKEEIADTCFQVATVGIEVLQTSEVLPVLEIGTQFYQELALERPNDPRLRKAAAKCLFLRGYFHASRHEHDRAIGDFERSRDAFLQVLKSNPSDQDAQQEFVAAAGNIAVTYAGQGNHRKAEEAFRHLVSHFEDVAKQRELTMGDRVQLAETHTHLAKLQPAAQRFAEIDKSIAVRRQLVSDFPTNIRLQHHLARSYVLAGAAHRELGQPADAMSLFRQALEIMERSALESPLLIARRIDLAELRTEMGQLHADLKEFDAARASFEQAHQDFEELAKTHPSLPAVAGGRLKSLQALADIHLALGNAAEAAALSLMHKALNRPPESPLLPGEDGPD